MPIRYVCRKCGYVLWSFEKVGQDYFGVPAPEDIIRIYGVCPRCKRDLSIPSIEDVVIEFRTKPLIVAQITDESSIVTRIADKDAVQET